MQPARIVDQTDLHYQDNRSDKVYHAAVIEFTDGTFQVPFLYGRRGSTLTGGRKYSGQSSAQARNEYNKIVNEKMGKGYRPAPGISGSVFGWASVGIPSVPTAVPAKEQPKHEEPAIKPLVLRRLNDKTPTGILPQLLNPITEEEAIEYFGFSDWGMQQKMNGTRLMVEKTPDGIRFINRKGFEIPAVQEIAEGVNDLGVNCLLDGEAIGNVYHVFDCLFLENEDLSLKGFAERYKAISRVITKQGKSLSANIKLVLLATTQNSKDRLWKMVKEANEEGVVLKDMEAPYEAGRPNSGGRQLKVKFWESCSCIVINSGNGKRSVSLALIGSEGEILVGRVTIPSNYDIPQAGQVVEIKYLYAHKGGSIYQPVYQGVRTDIEANECLLAQLKYKPDVDGSK